MSKCSEWIEDMLGAVKETNDPAAVRLVECCGRGCARRKKAEEVILQLKDAASNCKTRADYAAFLNNAMPITVAEAEDGIILHLGKTECSCTMAKNLSQNSDMLCECTSGHEKAVWSALFGKPVEVEIVESFLRGGNDCVLKIIF